MDKVYIGTDKLLPLERFLPKPKAAGGRVEKPTGRQGMGAARGRGGARGNFLILTNFFSIIFHIGRGGARGGMRGGRGGFGAARGGARGGFAGRGKKITLFFEINVTFKNRSPAWWKRRP